MPPAKQPTSDEIRSTREAVAILVQVVADRATTGRFISDRKHYARALSHLAAALAELPD
jgi:hypothetical protein